MEVELNLIGLICLSLPDSPLPSSRALQYSDRIQTRNRRSAAAQKRTVNFEPGGGGLIQCTDRGQSLRGRRTHSDVATMGIPAIAFTLTLLFGVTTAQPDHRTGMPALRGRGHE
ncbi:hypothetical protein SKAU_G00370730 [Synaphobranchus kaupii]|uniref:Uncharacterized protein n=1 Tax=Synaphobranchus kaupii TaxID=118154 RepID=A0A9Q1EG27_SYNKA|nr:hypothetical protein SKAU_G00370730 [Synaphobranchus kaupii]